MMKGKSKLLILIAGMLLVLAATAFAAGCACSPEQTPPEVVYSGGQMQLTWKNVDGAESYEIYRAGSRLSEFVKIDTTSELKYNDGDTNGNKYQNYYKIVAKRSDGSIISTKELSLEGQMFGNTIKIYDPEYDEMSNIENDINLIHDNEMFGGSPERGEFTPKRYALFLKPGEYKDMTKLQVGFYTQLVGLGATPNQTKVYASIETPPHLASNNATCTFWRSVENFEVCAGTFKWGVSQAAPVRRMKVDVKAEFDWNGGWSSGGFSVDCQFNAAVGSTTQQQWYARNCDFTSKALGNTGGYNQVIQGSTGVLPKDNYATGGQTTILENTDIIREKPFVYMDVGEYKVFVPSLKTEAQGTSWTDDYIGDGVSLDLNKDFYIAKSDVDDVTSLNNALSSGKNIFFTPGRYILDAPLKVTKANTVVLGYGLATLIPSEKNSYGAIYVADVDNVTVAGLMLDALYDSTYLICVGEADAGKSHDGAPTLLADVFMRVGGFWNNNVRAEYSALINSNNVIGDHFWAWRADHGSGIGWDKNIAPYGVVVTGDDVTIYGLFVEHYQKYQTLWMGERGRTYFYQNELPYDPVNQDAYMSHDGTVKGYAAYKVANTVNDHIATGMGIYAVFNKTGEKRDKSESVFLDNAIEVPNKPNVYVRRARLTDFSTDDKTKAYTGMKSVINGAGNGVSTGGGLAKITANAYVVEYVNGVANTPGTGKTGTQTSDEVFNLPTKLLP